MPASGGACGGSSGASGPRSGRVYQALRDRIVHGTLRPGAKLPPHTALATEFGVAPVTARLVLKELEREGLVSIEHGRGTFVREIQLPIVLIVDDEAPVRQLLAHHVTLAGYRPLEADGPEAAMAALEADRQHAIALVLSDVRMPGSGAGVGFIRTVRRRWPDLPLAAVTAFPDDLQPLHDTPECPVLLLSKPVWARQIREVLHLALPASRAAHNGQVANPAPARRRRRRIPS